MKEIITIQIGDYANFIGSHFWNIQDELLGLAEEPSADPVYKNRSMDMDVFYRAGETQQGDVTYTPRLLSIGLQGSLGSLSSRGSIYHDFPVNEDSNLVTWTGKVSRHVSEPHKKNRFLQSLYKEEIGQSSPSPSGVEETKDEDLVESLENDVQFWTDFSKVHYHPQSLYEFKGLFTDAQKFDNYGIGKDVFSEGLCGDELNDRLRLFLEECDHVQGIQFIVDDSGGFSSVAADFLENIADDYTNTPVLLYSARGPAVNPRNQKGSVSRALHDAVSFARLSSYCKLIVPIGLPSLSTSNATKFLRIDEAKAFHSSAVYAAALHSISMPFRMASPGPTLDSSYATGSVDIGGVVRMLGDQGRQNMVTILDVAMPAPPLTGSHNQQHFMESLHSLTPEVAENGEDLQAIESLSILGALNSGTKKASISEVNDSVLAAYESSDKKPRFSHLSASLCPLPIPLPFPSIFSNHVGQHGELLSNSPIPGPNSRGPLEVHSIPVAARLRSSVAVLPFIEKRLGHLRRFGIQRGGAGKELLRSWGFESDVVEDMGENLSKMVLALAPYSQDSSDSD
ncbi:hypothetical protein ACHQM5_023435 [Ranunculus cassubicifolius]